jgi:hypothetical protein
MDEYMAELARRFAASFISVQMHTSFNTVYRKLKDQRPGELWFSLARAATEAIAAHGQQAEAFFKAETTGPLLGAARNGAISGGLRRNQRSQSGAAARLFESMGEDAVQHSTASFFLFAG